MQTLIQSVLDTVVKVQASPGALVAVVAISAFVLIGLSLYVVLQSLKRGSGS